MLSLTSPCTIFNQLNHLCLGKSTRIVRSKHVGFSPFENPFFGATHRTYEDPLKPESNAWESYMPFVEKDIRDSKKAAKPRDRSPRPFVPFYRMSKKDLDENYDRPMTYKFTGNTSVQDLAKNPKLLQSWRQEIQDKEELDMKYVDYNVNDRLIGTISEAEPSRWKSAEKDKAKRFLDPSLEFADDKFEVDDETDHYIVRGTRIPNKFDHFVENPGAIKKPRDLKLLKRIERAREREAAKRRMRQIGGNANDKEQESKSAVTVRMLRINNMLLEVANSALSDLPHYLSNHQLPGQTRVNSLAHSGILSDETLRFVNVEITQDLRIAKIFWEAIDGREDVIERELIRASPAIRHLVTQSANLKYSPELKFFKDMPSQEQQEVNELMKRAESYVKQYSESDDRILHEDYELSSPEPARITVKLKKGTDSTPIVTPFHQKFMRSKWTPKKPPPYPSTEEFGPAL